MGPDKTAFPVIWTPRVLRWVQLLGTERMFCPEGDAKVKTAQQLSSFQMLMKWEHECGPGLLWQPAH